MSVFKYVAATSSGKKQKDFIDAGSRSQATRKLKEQGLFPLEIKQVQSKGASKDGSSIISRLFSQKIRVPKDAVAASIRQLATLLKVDMPLDRALDALIKGDGKQDALQRIMIDVRETVREGGDLATAFAKHPNVFNTTFVTMVRAGESSGTLSIVMDRLADHIEQQLALKRKVQATMAYPVLMLIVGVSVVIFLLSYVVPKVTEIFFDMGRALPLPTQILIATSDAIREFWGVILLAVLIVGYGCFRACKTEQGRKTYHRLLLNTPVLGLLLKRISVGRFTKTLGMLLKNGVSLVAALDIVKTVAGNEVMKEVIEAVHEDILEGKALAGPLETSGIFEYTATQMISAGEQSGQLDEMLLIVANDCENKINTSLQTLTSLMEPIMILLLGGMVGFVVMAIMLPMFEMSNLVGG